MASHPQGFFEIAVAPHTKFKDADAIANAIGCAPLPEILIQKFLIAWFEQGSRYAPAKTAMTEPNRIVSPSFNSASVTKSPLTVSRSLNLILQRIGIAGSQKRGVLR
jgi:hypothetical protein